MTRRIGPRRRAARQPAQQRGAALLVALLIAALVTTTLTVMLQRQSALAGIEWQMRETAQARRILQGAEDWALLILRADAHRSIIDHLGEPWAIPLREGRLADFLKAAADAASTPVAEPDSGRLQGIWLSGRIVDADARYNLMRLSLAGVALPRERALWLRIAAQAGVPAALAHDVADRFAPPVPLAASSFAAPQSQQPLQPLPPLSLAQLSAQLPALAPWAAQLSALAVILPDATTINVNTAAKPVLMALIPGLDDTQAERFLELRRKAPWRDLNSISAAFAEKPFTIDPAQAGVASRYFVISARVRLGEGTAPQATAVNMNTTVERLPQENLVRIIRRDFNAALQ